MSGETVRCQFKPAPKPAPSRAAGRAPRSSGPSRAARMLALAHHIARQIDEGAIPDYATAAQALGLTRARLTQVMNLLLLAPEVQERIAVGEISVSERDLRRVSAEPDWNGQCAMLAKEAAA